MAAHRSKPEVVVIVGPTASGKSDLAIKIAKQFSGEIIAADSRTIFKKLDIGTAKPSKEDLAGVPHWGINLVNPGEHFTAADFKRLAEHKVEEIKAQGKLPIIVGGTGLYIDAFLYDFKFRPVSEDIERAELENLSVEQLQQLVLANGYHMPENSKNKRHLIRVLETKGNAPRQGEMRQDSLTLGIMPPDHVLKDRINERAKLMFKRGVVNEYKKIARNYPAVSTNNYGIVYKLCSDVVSGVITEQEAIERFQIADWHYARRQKTWFKRNPYIKWFRSADEAEQFIYSALNT